MLSWHIDKVADPTFFRLDSLDNLSMPDRDRVPEYTIVRYVNRQLDLERLQTQFTVREEAVPPVIASDRAETMAGQVKARQLVQAWTDSMVTDSSWEKIECVLHHLRSEFTFDRTRDFSQADEPLAQFLETRTGNDLMFATAAAVMLEQLGFETRLATGFVAYRQNRLGWTDEIGVYPRDMHAWLEVNVGPGVWAPLEPTPGYPQPQYHVTWRYWVRHHALAILGWTIGLLAMISLLYWQRALAFDCLCGSLGWLLWIGNDRQRCRWLLHVLDLRCRLTGHSRPNHVVPKQWYTRLGNSQPVGLQANASSNHWSASLDVFFREADQLWFGNARTLSTAGREACRVLWYRSTCHSLRTIFQSNSRFVA
ncbi:MAG: transglutaminase domain-containing protein [Pirellulaceae bacterium]|nr:transglutaminase domain-containing protein [Pirellulaceae bacterium]